MFWRSAGAVILALITHTAVATLTGFLIAVWNRLTSTTRPEIIDFFAVIIAAVLGMVAAKAACDKIFKVYAKRPIFVLFGTLSALGLVIVMFLLEEPETPIISSAQAIATAIAAWVIFWRRDRA